MRRYDAKSPSFGAGLEDEMQMSVLEVADSAVHETRGAARRSAPEVSLVDESDAQAAQSRVTRDSRAGDPATDDEEIESAAR